MFDQARGYTALGVPDDQLTDASLTTICLCGLEVDVSAANEGAYV